MFDANLSFVFSFFNYLFWYNNFDITIALQEFNEIFINVCLQKINFFEKFKHWRDHISYFNIFFYFPELVDDNKGKNPIKRNWQWLWGWKIGVRKCCFCNLSFNLSYFYLLSSFVNRDHMSFHMIFVHDLAADGADTISLIWLLPIVLWMFSFNVPCSMIGNHLLLTMLAGPFHGRLVILSNFLKKWKFLKLKSIKIT